MGDFFASPILTNVLLIILVMLVASIYTFLKTIARMQWNINY